MTFGADGTFSGKVVYNNGHYAAFADVSGTWEAVRSERKTVGRTTTVSHLITLTYDYPDWHNRMTTWHDPMIWQARKDPAERQFGMFIDGPLRPDVLLQDQIVGAYVVGPKWQPPPDRGPICALDPTALHDSEACFKCCLVDGVGGGAQYEGAVPSCKCLPTAYRIPE